MILIGGRTTWRAPRILALPPVEQLFCTANIRLLADKAERDTMTRPEMVRRILWVCRAAFLAMKPMVPHANVAMGTRMAQDMNFDTSAAQADFGWNPRGFARNSCRVSPLTRGAFHLSLRSHGLARNPAAAIIKHRAQCVLKTIFRTPSESVAGAAGVTNDAR
jgi:hypothetical protein